MYVIIVVTLSASVGNRACVVLQVVFPNSKLVLYVRCLLFGVLAGGYPQQQGGYPRQQGGYGRPAAGGGTTVVVQGDRGGGRDGFTEGI